MHTAAQAVLRFWDLEAALNRCLSSADGLALLALLCNAAAKQNCSMYQYKAALVEAACKAASPARWWVAQHRYGRAVRIAWFDRFNVWCKEHIGFYLLSQNMPAYFIETDLLLDGQPLQVSFHFLPGDSLPQLADAPAANGREWRGQRAQARALEIAQAWLASSS